MLRKWLFFITCCCLHFPHSHARLCEEVEVFNTVSEFELNLRGCTVVLGYLKIVMERPKVHELQNISFPELTEIRGYLLLYRVYGLTSVGKLFPNLSVIRGTTLLADYSFLLHDLPNLQESTMDEQTALVLALQLIALFSIAGALLLYLLCKIRNNSGLESSENMIGGGKPILITSCDNALGLQIAMHFANRGFRVFAGLREGASSGSPNDSTSARVIRAWQKHRESLTVPLQGSLIALPLDVTREDISHEAVDIIRAHLPAGEDGVWAVINTSGVSYRGRFDQQDVAYWDAMLKTNIIGVLRTARIFQSLLRKTSGRIINIGATNGEESGLVAYTATKYAIQGASNALRQEFSPLGIKVITIDPRGILPELMYSMPKIKSKEDNEVSLNISGTLEYQPLILTPKALQIVDTAVSSPEPKHTYTLMQRPYWCKPLRLIHV